ncbi:hypothetical protein BGZ76_005894 [Entomortierella beljakovae]|nr:hypothetical protein BGZ76_005894 [Entomortierella beljakovae]
MSEKPINSAGSSAKAKQESNLVGETEYDKLVDEDWLDINDPSYPQTAASPYSSTHDDQQVPASDSPVYTRKEDAEPFNAVSPSAFSYHSDFEDASSSPLKNTTLSAKQLTIDSEIEEPALLKVSTKESQEQEGQTYTAESPSPTSTSDSDYSLLGPSSEQSRKNSLSSTSGFQPLTSNDVIVTADQAPNHLHPQVFNQERGQDSQQITGVTSPLLSDFEQVMSDQEEFSGMESISGRSSNNGTSSSTSSGRKEPLGNDAASAPVPESETISSTGFASTQNKNIDNGVDITSAEGAIGRATTDNSPSSPTPSARLAKYRTTVEDAENSEDEQNFRDNSDSGLRYRGQQDGQGNSSFFGSAQPTSTMPGSFNFGTRSDTPVYNAPAATMNTDPPVDERQCRICLGGADEEDTLGRLISPCLCKGSMKYVHVECLNAWRARSQKRESHYKCDTCKYSFSFRRTSFAKYLAHPLTVFALTIIVFIAAVFAAGFAMKLLLYLMMDEPQEFIYSVDIDDYEDEELVQLKENVVIFKTPDSLRAVFRIDKTHMVFGSFFVSIIGFLQLLLSTIWMGGGGGVFRIGGFGLGGGRRRGERQREAWVGGALMVVVLVFGLFKSLYMTYQFVHRMSRRVLAKAELMVLEVQ